MRTAETAEPATEQARAVIYLRVSTKDQATRGGEAEGFSIPAQREACRRKAASLNAIICEEFADRGESARSARRPELQRMLTFVEEQPVDYVIVHKVDRLARSRVDDVEITVALQRAGAKLISCTENIDETPSGILLHGIMSSIAEFYSRNLANEVNKGLIQKAKNGGTPFRPPVGYRPVRVFTEDGREVRSVEIDPERGPLVQQAFELYATGEWTTRTLLGELTSKGLVSRATPKRPSKALTNSSFHEMLRNPYYIGIVDYRGVRYDGKHPPLISQGIFDEVQRILEAQNFAGEKQRKHPHYLKGSIWCGCCGSRLIVANSRSHTGRVYPYFICIGRQRDPKSCTQRALLIDRVEELVAGYYERYQLGHDLRLETEQDILEQMAALRENEVHERDRLVRRQRKLLDERAKLLEAHYAGAIPLDLLKTEQERISSQLQRIEEQLSSTDIKYLEAERTLQRSLELAERLASAYRDAPPSVRRLMNQALFHRLIIDADEGVTGELNDPFALLMEAAGSPQKRQEARNSGPHGLSKTKLVDQSGLEPPTSA
ncbi:MAG TPA: recombinase family protein [Fimbriimonadaceae bacterium]|nr:recombinase family protein [Fimbriimonadaceae bacterium]